MSTSSNNNNNNEATRCGNHHLDPVLDDEASSPNNYMSRFNEVGSSPDMSEGACRNANTKNTCASNPFLEGTPCLSESSSGRHQKAIHSLGTREQLSDELSGFVINGHSCALSEIVEAARNRNCNNTAPAPHHLQCDSHHIDPLRTICKKYNIPLRDSVIDKLNAEQVIESGEFEVLDSARLSEIGIKSREDRMKVLKLVKLYNNEELFELRDRFDRAFTRSQLQARLFSLHQQWLSLVMQMPCLLFRLGFVLDFNHTDFYHGRANTGITNDEMQLNIETVEELISIYKADKLCEKDYRSCFFYDPWTPEDVETLRAFCERVRAAEEQREMKVEQM